MSSRKEKGQYFTTDEFLKKTVLNLILNKPIKILEPSMGRGDLADYILKHKATTEFHLYELDPEIPLLESINREKVKYTNFLDEFISEKYKTIIGNPPYVRTKKGNLYLDFIKKCYELLKDGGELIFIVHSNFIKLTSASKLIDVMLENGTFTHIVYPQKENLFENAFIDVMVFRYCKNSKLENMVIVNGNKFYLLNNNGIITFSEKNKKIPPLFSEYFDIFVGQVTGCETVYKNTELGNIKILNKENQEDNYILIKTFPTKNKILNQYLLKHKQTLLKRKIKKFNEKNWFTWGALRNYGKVEKFKGQDCIYIHTSTRNKKVAFIDKVKFFGGNLILMLPKKSINLEKTLQHLNSENFRKNHTYAGRFKIGQRVLSNSLINKPTT